MKLHTAFFLCAGLLAAQPALAGAGHDHGPKYGGIVREMHGMTYELVAKPDSLTVYVSDHDKPIPTQGAQAEAVIYANNGKTLLKLQPAGNNRLEAKGSFKVGVGVRIALSVTLPGQSPANATYGLK
jgi:hypothetical protein